MGYGTVWYICFGDIDYYGCEHVHDGEKVRLRSSDTERIGTTALGSNERREQNGSDGSDEGSAGFWSVYEWVDGA